MDQDTKNRVEAILFTVGRFVDLEELKLLTEIGSPGVLNECLKSIKEDYDKKNSSLQIINEDNKWKLAVRKEYLFLTEKLLTSTEMDRPTQETLAVIAYRNPALQSDIIKIRGNTAYDHIPILEDLGFINSEKYGRSKLLKLTQKFYDYFEVVEHNIKSKLEKNDEQKAE